MTSEPIRLGIIVDGHFYIDAVSIHALMNLGRIMGDEPFNVIKTINLRPLRERSSLGGFTAWQAEKLFGHPFPEEDA